MNVGKLPANLLARLLDKVHVKDPTVLLGPHVGEDAALIDIGDRLLVAKSDPVTFATDRIGWYVVQVNANDVAAMGAKPRWFLCTLLLPESTTETQAESIFDQLHNACRQLDISLVGGHTEITYGLERPIAVGMMLGEVAKGDQLLTSGACVGDNLLLSKGIAIEGTCLLARDASNALEAHGVSQTVIRRAAKLLDNPGISIVPEAQILREIGGVHAMHDPTEGGLATGLHELAQAANVGLEIDAGTITILPDTHIICEALQLNPMGLLASGALLASVNPCETPTLLNSLSQHNIQATIIGRVVPPEQGVTIITASQHRPIPIFHRDELARFFSSH